MKEKFFVSKRGIIQWILIILLYEAHDSAFYKMFEWPIIILTLLLVGYCFLKYPNMRKKKVILFCIFLLVDIAFVRFLNDGGIGISLYLRWVSMFLVAWAAYSIKPEKFIDKFVKFTVFMAVVSLVFWGLCFWDVEAIRDLSFLSYEPWKDATHYGGILFTVIEGYERNSGVFNEPGLYQILLNVALFLILFRNNDVNTTERKKTLMTFVLVITIITTQSTTAYLGLFCIIVGYILGKADSKLRRRLVGLLLASVVLIVADFIARGDDSLFSTVVIDKIQDINHDTSSDQIVASGQSRLITIQMSLESALREPFGIGIDRYNLELRGSTQYAEAAVGAVLFSSMATMGIFAVGIIVAFFIHGVWKNRVSGISFWVALFLFFNILAAQSDLFYPALWVLMFVGERITCNSMKMGEANENSMVMQ